MPECTTVIGPARASGFSVSYCLVSTDGSAKAGLLRDSAETAWGVLFSIASAERRILDQFEGAPSIYTRETVSVFSERDDVAVEAVTYIPHPERVRHDHLPYGWYRALCAGGARQHALPELAIARLATGGDTPMPKSGKRAHEGRSHAIAALMAAGLLVHGAEAFL